MSEPKVLYAGDTKRWRVKCERGGTLEVSANQILIDGDFVEFRVDDELLLVSNFGKTTVFYRFAPQEEEPPRLQDSQLQEEGLPQEEKPGDKT